jgi:hypothetical protein
MVDGPRCLGTGRGPPCSAGPVPSVCHCLPPAPQNGAIANPPLDRRTLTAEQPSYVSAQAQCPVLDEDLLAVAAAVSCDPAARQRVLVAGRMQRRQVRGDGGELAAAALPIRGRERSPRTWRAEQGRGTERRRRRRNHRSRRPGSPGRSRWRPTSTNSSLSSARHPPIRKKRRSRARPRSRRAGALWDFSQHGR